MISIEYTYKIEFKILNSLTGLWKDDYKNIEMYVKNIEGNIDKGTGSTRLIMGFGPSASGKSYNTLRIIELHRPKRKMRQTFYKKIKNRSVNLFNVCFLKYQEYIRITDDTDWIGVLIYQHKTDKECDLDNFKDYACIGTTISGKTREIKEGKKYSNNEWQKKKKSYDNGYREMMKAPRYRFKIHNTGRRDGINIFYDYSKPYLNLDKKIINFFLEKNWIYKKDSNILS